MQVFTGSFCIFFAGILFQPEHIDYTFSEKNNSCNSKVSSSMVGSFRAAASDAKRQKLLERQDQIPEVVKHPDIGKFVQVQPTTACRKLCNIAALENQQPFIVEAGAATLALRMLGSAKAASSAAAQLLEALIKYPDVREKCVEFPRITKVLMEVMKDAQVEQPGRCSAVLLLSSQRLAAASAFLIHPAVSMMRAPDLPRGKEYAVKMLASLAAVQNLASTIADSGAVADLAAALSGPEQRWAALALYQLARGLGIRNRESGGEKGREAVDGARPALVQLLKESVDAPALAAAAEALRQLAEEPTQRKQLRSEAAVFLPCLLPQEDKSVYQEAAAQILLSLLQDPGDHLQFDEDLAERLSLEARRANIPVESGKGLVQRLRELVKTEDEKGAFCWHHFAGKAS
eukprot:s2984_g5.t8